MNEMRPGVRLTPEVAASVSFPPARLGRRGLDERHVREFTALVEGELTTLASERAALQGEVARLRRALSRAGDENGTGYRRDTHVEAVGILTRARQTADQYVAEAQEYSRQMAADARRRRDDILAQARVRATLEGRGRDGASRAS